MEQRQGQRTLPAPGATDDPDTFTRLDVEAEAAENFGAICTVLCGQALNNEFSAGGPIGRRDTLRCRVWLLFDIDVLLNSLQTRCSSNQDYLSTRGITESHLFPLNSNSFKHLTHHKIMVLDPTAMFNKKPMFAADPG